MSTPSAPPAPLALVTGASSGIGVATCHALAGAGFRLALVARRPERLEDSLAKLRAEHPACDARAFPGDVSDPGSINACIEAARSAMGRFDVVVNNAGAAPLATIAETTPEMLRELFGLNVFGPAEVVRALWDDLTANQASRPCVVNISSYAGADPFPGFYAYAGTKAALDIMTLVTAQEGQLSGLRAFAVAPGAVETPLLRSLFDEDAVAAEACLAPESVAALVAACVRGDHDDKNGGVLYIKQGETGPMITDRPV